MIQSLRPIDLMIVGAQKAGTTSLLRYLSQHPQICFHPHREMVFFRNDEMYQKGYNYAWRKYFGECNRNRIVLAKDVMSIYSEKALKRLKEHNSEIILVILLREPVSRAYSAYWYARRRGWEFIKTFEEALKAEKKRLETDGWEKWHQNAYIHNSVYYPHIKNCFKIFNKSNIKIYLTEWLINNSFSICKELFSMLNINHNFIPETAINYNPGTMPKSDIIGRSISFIFNRCAPLKSIFKLLLSEKKLTEIRHFLLSLNEANCKIPPINPFTKKWLKQHFRQYNLSLQELTGINISHWNDE